MVNYAQTIAWIKPLPLLVGFFVGLIAIFIHKPEPLIVYKYPTPDTCHLHMYKDSAGSCFKFETVVVDCDKNEAKLKEFPLQ
jgi:hypothetical protein